MIKSSYSFTRAKIQLCTLLTFAGIVVSLATILGFAGHFSWIFDLFSHFRVQYLISLAILGIVLLPARRFKTAGLFIGLACLNLATILPLYLGGTSQPLPNEQALRAMLLNVNTELGDSGRVTQVIRDVNPDIIVLEEINSQWMRDLAWLTNSYPYVVARIREDNFGIGIFSKLPLVDGQINYIGSVSVPSVFATFRTGSQILNVIATHPPPPNGRAYSRWRNEQLNLLPEYIQSSGPIILLGDLNVTPWNYYFRRLLHRSGLKDSTRGYGVQPSWPSFNRLLRIPIDHCLHSEDVKIVGRKIGENVSSDHFPLIVDITIDANPSR